MQALSCRCHIRARLAGSEEDYSSSYGGQPVTFDRVHYAPAAGQGWAEPVGAPPQPHCAPRSKRSLAVPCMHHATSGSE